MFKELIHWSEKFKDLPWRKKRSAYRVLVSEIMLQQTTVSTVKNYFDNFITRFPDLKSLADATEEEVLISWKGLGYYRRAKNLKKAADFICENFNGVIPDSYNDLVSIPGIGDYTASAILSFVYNKNIFAIDSNLERVLSRLFLLKEPKGPRLIKEIKELQETDKIQKLMSEFTSSKINEGLMDVGRNYCKKNEVSCELCPLSSHCLAFKKGNPLEFPVIMESKKVAKKFDLNLLRVIIYKGDKLLVYKKNEDEWLHGQNEVPTFILDSEDKSLIQYPKIKYETHGLLHYKTLITKYKITNFIIEMSLSEFKKIKESKRFFWCDPEDLRSNLSRATIKALEKNRERI